MKDSRSERSTHYLADIRPALKVEEDSGITRGYVARFDPRVSAQQSAQNETDARHLANPERVREKNP